MGDWDLIRRVSAVVPIRRLATLGSIYRSGRTDQISSTEPLGWNRHLLERKRPRHDAEGLRILAVEWHYPQLTESYVQADIDGLVALGAHVEVATTDPGTAAPYPTDQAVHRDGVLGVAAADPDVVLVHWLGIGDTVAEEPTRRVAPCPSWSASTAMNTLPTASARCSHGRTSPPSNSRPTCTPRSARPTTPAGAAGGVPVRPLHAGQSVRGRA
ncbi:MAG: hypothetical protein R2699_04720 [Acidimicrobiales bacterium]